MKNMYIDRKSSMYKMLSTIAFPHLFQINLFTTLCIISIIYNVITYVFYQDNHLCQLYISSHSNGSRNFTYEQYIDKETTT